MLLISNGAKSYTAYSNERVIFRELDFNLDHNITVIMGPNGCGKSTLLKVLMNMEPLDAGILSYSPSKEDLFASVLQNYKIQLLPYCTVEENLEVCISNKAIFPNLSLKACLKKVRDRLELFGYDINFNSKAGSLSGGEQQALVLARSFLVNPRLWLLDEPVSAIDFRRRAKILESIKIRSSESLVLLISHDINDAILIGSRLIVFGPNMQIILNRKLPPFIEGDIDNRINSGWATELREEMIGLTHHLQ